MSTFRILMKVTELKSYEKINHKTVYVYASEKLEQHRHTLFDYIKEKPDTDATQDFISGEEQPDVIRKEADTWNTQFIKQITESFLTAEHVSHDSGWNNLATFFGSMVSMDQQTKDDIAAGQSFSNCLYECYKALTVLQGMPYYGCPKLVCDDDNCDDFQVLISKETLKDIHEHPEEYVIINVHYN